MNSINKEYDLFYNPVNDEEKEDLLGFGNKRYYNKDNKDYIYHYLGNNYYENDLDNYVELFEVYN